MATAIDRYWYSCLGESRLRLLVRKRMTRRRESLRWKPQAQGEKSYSDTTPLIVAHSIYHSSLGTPRGG